jgi:hypothetical protein
MARMMILVVIPKTGLQKEKNTSIDELEISPTGIC